MNIEKLKRELVSQKNSKFKGNIYHYSQVNFAYNSNKIEGTHLSEDETEEIFVTNSYIPKSDDVVKLDDLMEMKNHFRLFDYMLDIYEKKLDKNIINEMNKSLKRGTSDEYNPRYNVGGFKIVPNKIGLINVINTSSPKDTPKDIDNLLSWYNSLKNITLEDIIEFHYKFEKIHPFGDENEPLGQQKTYLQKYLQNKGFTDFGKSFFLNKFSILFNVLI